LAPFQRCQPELELINPVAEDLYLGLVGEPPLRGAPQSWRGLGACGDDRERHQPLRPVRSVSAAASRGTCAGSTTMVRVPASLTAPPRDRWDWHMRAARPTLRAHLQAGGPGGVVR
jgi:hypothetical protein